MKPFSYTLYFFLMVTHTMVAQLIKVEEAATNQDIINELVSGCININPSSILINGSPDFKSMGIFSKNNSNFPFNSGILISSGNIDSAGNTAISENLNEGSPSWGSDPDIEAYTSSENTFNATTIEFDFISATNFISFNYILASEEYGNEYICDYADGFAFLIKEAGGSYRNIALLPNGTAVNTNTVHGGYKNYCPPSNSDYFEGIDIGDTNFKGRTKVLTASANIDPYKTYHIKLVIADQGDTNFDSAAFIEGNSFEASVDLGPDISTCTKVTLNADIENTTAQYNWYLDGALLNNPTNSPTWEVDKSGTYSVKIDISINGTPCPEPIEDEIFVDFNEPVEIDLGNTLATRCDDDGDGKETFSLTDYNPDLIAQIKDYISDNNFNITFHNSKSGAQNGTDQTTSPITLNAGNSKTIYTRIEGKDFKCTGFLQFDLTVNAKPDIETNIKVTRCDTDVTFSLDSFDSQITKGNSSYNVSYHYTQEQAELGLQPITNYYRNINTTDTLYVRVEDPVTGCLSITDMSLTALESPKINNSNDYIISGCNTTSGSTTFDLTASVSDILSGLNTDNFLITYHTDYSDAESGTNPIPDPETYIASNPETIYMRVTPIGGGCSSIAAIDIYPNVLLSIENETLTDYANCGGSTFDLFIIANDIAHSINGLTVNFFSDPGYTIPIIKTDNYTIPNGTSQLLYIEMTLDNCPNYSVKTELTIFTTDPLDYHVPLNPMHCSLSPAIDFKSELDPLIDYNNKGYTIKYYLNESDRDNDKNTIPPFMGYESTQTSIPIWARVIQDISSPPGTCYDPINFEIQISPIPIVNIGRDNFSYCVTDTEVKTPIQSIIDEIAANTSPTNADIKIYETLTDAESGNAQYLSPIDSTATTTLYSRISNSQNADCALVYPIDVRVFLKPEFSNKDDFFVCGATQFGLNDIDKNALLTNYSPLLFQVKYYLNGVQLSSTAQVNVTAGPVTIDVEVSNRNSTGCTVSKKITLSTTSYPEFEEPTDFYECLAASATTLELDLNLKVNEISKGHSGLDITFYTNEADAEARINMLPLLFSNTESVLNLFARIENAGVTECYEIVDFGVYVAQEPEITDATPIVNCATDYLGENVVFNLTDSYFEILDKRQKNLVVHYFTSIADIEAITDPTNITTQITDPTQYVKTSGSTETVYVAVINTVSGCYSAKPIALSTIPPPDTKILSVYNFCETPDQKLNLNEINNQLVFDLNTVSISYFISTADATNNTNPLDAVVYDYLSNGLFVFAKVQDNTTGCYIIKPVTLNPINSNLNNLNFTADNSVFEPPNTITVNATGGSGNYMYSIDFGELQASNIFEEVTTGSHDITVIDLSGCAKLTKPVITLDIPKFFTPNNDNFHDTWHITGVEYLDQAEVFIFDRYGKLLKSLYQNSSGWDGTYRGEPMPTDDYWYLANLVYQGTPIKRKGHFTLKR